MVQVIYSKLRFRAEIKLRPNLGLTMVVESVSIDHYTDVTMQIPLYKQSVSGSLVKPTTRLGYAYHILLE